MLRSPALSRVVAEDGPSSPVVQRYGFPEAESDPLRLPSPSTSEQRSPSPAAESDPLRLPLPSTSEQRSPSPAATFDEEDLHVDPLVE